MLGFFFPPYNDSISVPSSFNSSTALVIQVPQIIKPPLWHWSWVNTRILSCNLEPLLLVNVLNVLTGTQAQKSNWSWTMYSTWRTKILFFPKYFFERHLAPSFPELHVWEEVIIIVSTGFQEKAQVPGGVSQELQSQTCSKIVCYYHHHHHYFRNKHIII